MVDDPADVPAILDDLGLSAPRPVLLLVGGAASLDPAVVPRLAALFRDAVVPAVVAAGAAIVDGGTDAGVMRLAGWAVHEAGEDVLLVGVAPAAMLRSGEARVEPHHSRVIRSAGSEWGSETGLLFEVAASIAGPNATVVLVAGGGAVTRNELVEAAKRGLPILALAGTGGIADAVDADAGVEVLAPGIDPGALRRRLVGALLAADRTSGWGAGAAEHEDEPGLRPERLRDRGE